MTVVTVRQRNQITIPKAIAEAAGIAEGTVLDLRFEHGRIVVTMPGHRRADFDPMVFAGIGRGIWGDSLDEIDATWQADRDSWERDLPDVVGD